MPDASNRSQRLDRVIADLLAQAPEVEAAAIVSYDGLAMASALPVTMDEGRVAAMSAALLSLGERAAEGLGRGGLNQVYIEGETGNVFLVSADEEAVLVAVASKGAKVGMMLYEVRRAAEAVADVLRVEYASPLTSFPLEAGADARVLQSVEPPAAEPEQGASYAPSSADPAWVSHLSTGAPATSAEPQPWSSSAPR
jgi:predicted regulator of Ras-like GTPase activity (Roadblock/LC7/MglB family)